MHQRSLGNITLSALLAVRPGLFTRAYSSARKSSSRRDGQVSGEERENQTGDSPIRSVTGAQILPGTSTADGDEAFRPWIGAVRHAGGGQRHDPVAGPVHEEQRRGPAPVPGKRLPPRDRD